LIKKGEINGLKERVSLFLRRMLFRLESIKKVQ